MPESTRQDWLVGSPFTSYFMPPRLGGLVESRVCWIVANANQLDRQYSDP